ncbi:MAG TPA: hypothetical protein PLO78_01270 [Candidatus Omnitrophota bacterium]|nr:hypothetical protein [Candidatus Omnitrophota bacterium]
MWSQTAAGHAMNFEELAISFVYNAADQETSRDQSPETIIMGHQKATG